MRQYALEVKEVERIGDDVGAAFARGVLALSALRRSTSLGET